MSICLACCLLKSCAHVLGLSVGVYVRMCIVRGQARVMFVHMPFLASSCEFDITAYLQIAWIIQQLQREQSALRNMFVCGVRWASRHSWKWTSSSGLTVPTAASPKRLELANTITQSLSRSASEFVVLRGHNHTKSFELALLSSMCAPSCV